MCDQLSQVAIVSVLYLSTFQILYFRTIYEGRRSCRCLVEQTKSFNELCSSLTQRKSNNRMSIPLYLEDIFSQRIKYRQTIRLLLQKLVRKVVTVVGSFDLNNSMYTKIHRCPLCFSTILLTSHTTLIIDCCEKLINILSTKVERIRSFEIV